MKSETADAHLPWRGTTYSNAWISDINAGLLAWVDVGHDLAKKLVFNAAGNMDTDGAGEVLEDYWFHHALSMLGAPDGVGAVLAIFDQFMDWLEDLIQWDPFEELKERILDWMVQEITGQTVAQWKALFQGLPIQQIRDQIDALMALQAGNFDWRQFPAAYNSVIMSKLLLLPQSELSRLLHDLGVPEVYADSQAPVNAMLGFIRSLDEDNEWNKHSAEMVMARDCFVYSKLFMVQGGDYHNPLTQTYGFHPSSVHENDCPQISSTTLSSAPPQEPWCTADVQVTATLQAPAPAPGAVVRWLLKDNFQGQPEYHYGWVPQGQQSAHDSFPIVLSEGGTTQIAKATGERIQSRTDTGQYRVPGIDALETASHALSGGALIGYTWAGQCPLALNEPLAVTTPFNPARIDISGPDMDGSYQPNPIGFALRVPVCWPEPPLGAQEDINADYNSDEETASTVAVHRRVYGARFNPPDFTMGGPITATVDLCAPAGPMGETIHVAYGVAGDPYGRVVAGPNLVVVPPGQTRVVFLFQIMATNAFDCGGYTLPVKLWSDLEDPTRATFGYLPKHYDAPCVDSQNCADYPVQFCTTAKKLHDLYGVDMESILALWNHHGLDDEMDLFDAINQLGYAEPTPANTIPAPAVLPP